MPYPFPPIVDIDFAAEDNKYGKQMIDSASSNFSVNTNKRKLYNLLYNAYNGVSDEKLSKYLTETYGKVSKTKFVRHRLGRSKMDLLDGEFLKLPLEASVFTVNREAINEKFESITKLMGMAKLKPHIEEMRAQGVNVLEGAEIPDEKQVQSQFESNFKSTNERIMQIILDDKVKNGKIKNRLAHNFSDLKITAECFGKVERDADGKDIYRPINPKYALYEEFINDPFLECSSYMGEVRFMSRHELLTHPEISLTVEEVKIIDEWVVSPSDYFGINQFENLNNTVCIPVCFMQWKGVETVRTKTEYPKDSSEPYIRTIHNKDYYAEKKKHDYNVEKGKYEITTVFKETLWEGIGIGFGGANSCTVYKNIRKVPYTMATRNGGNKYRVLYDYTGLLLNTQNGVRVSLQEMITEIEMGYDIAMFQLRRELNKVKGKALAFDRMAIPKGETVQTLIYKLTEDGFFDYSSGDDAVFGNAAQEKIHDISAALKTIDIGLSESVQMLLQLANHYERMIDRITGINENREGLGKATTTATGVQSAVEASRSITYPMFYFFNQYISEVLMKLCEKSKINPIYTDENSNNLLFSEKDKAFLRASKELCRDEFNVSIGDARRFDEIKQQMRSLYEPQLNAKDIRVHDIVLAEMEDTFAGYTEKLQKGYEETKKIAQQMQQEQTKQQQQLAKQQQDATSQDKQQDQANLEKITKMQNDSKERIAAMKIDADVDNKDKRLDHDDHHKTEDRRMDAAQSGGEQEDVNFF